MDLTVSDEEEQGVPPKSEAFEATKEEAQDAAVEQRIAKLRTGLERIQQEQAEDGQDVCAYCFQSKKFTYRHRNTECPQMKADIIKERYQHPDTRFYELVRQQKLAQAIGVKKDRKERTEQAKVHTAQRIREAEQQQLSHQPSPSTSQPRSPPHSAATEAYTSQRYKGTRTSPDRHRPDMLWT